MLAQTQYLQNAIRTDVAVAAEDTASQAVRRGRDSLRAAIAQVADKKADAVVSAGNTGALMAMSKLQLRTMPGVTGLLLPDFFQQRKADVYA